MSNRLVRGERSVVPSQLRCLLLHFSVEVRCFSVGRLYTAERILCIFYRDHHEARRQVMRLLRMKNIVKKGTGTNLKFRHVQ